VCDINNKHPIGAPPRQKSYNGWAPGLAQKKLLRHFAIYLSPNFAGIKKCEIWPPFSTTVALHMCSENRPTAKMLINTTDVTDRQNI